jgi:hypothetical protein
MTTSESIELMTRSRESSPRTTREVKVDKYEAYDQAGYEGVGASDPFNTQFTHDDPFNSNRSGVLGERDSPANKRQVGGSHYAEMAIQPSEFIVANNLGWYEGNAIKYICRHSRKGGKKDIEKAIHYLELLLESEYYGE